MFRQDTLNEEDDGFVYCREVDDMCVYTHVSSVLRLRKGIRAKAYVSGASSVGVWLSLSAGCNWWRCIVIRAGSNSSSVGVWLSLSAMFASCCGRLRLLRCLLLYVCVAMC